jgi:toxin ParE1/3/4
LLSLQPEIGRERKDLRSGLRSWPVHPYIVFYEVDRRSRTVTIERVIHGHMDIDEDDFEM